MRKANLQELESFVTKDGSAIRELAGPSWTEARNQSVAEATAVADKGDFEAAILDVNLGGELVYPVADLLSSRGIPFVFVTGYGRESIDRRFANAPVLEKPIELTSLEDIFGRSQENSVQLRMARVG